MWRAALIFLLLAGGYAAYSNFADRKEKQADAQAKTQERKALILALAYRNNANHDWTETISKGKSYRSSPVTTVEIQELWLSGRPILFVGNVNDIANKEANVYKLVLDYNPQEFRTSFSSTKLRLELLCTDSQLGKVMQASRDGNASLLWADTAVVAEIARVRSYMTTNEELGEHRIIIGSGTCVEAINIKKAPVSSK